MSKKQYDLNLGCGDAIWSFFKGLIALVIVVVIAIIVLINAYLYS